MAYVEYCGKNQEQLVKLVLNHQTQSVEIRNRLAHQIEYDVDHNHAQNGDKQDATDHTAKDTDGENPLVDGGAQVEDRFAQRRLGAEHEIGERLVKLIE